MNPVQILGVWAVRELLYHSFGSLMPGHNCKLFKDKGMVGPESFDQKLGHQFKQNLVERSLWSKIIRFENKLCSQFPVKKFFNPSL